MNSSNIDTELTSNSNQGCTVIDFLRETGESLKNQAGCDQQLADVICRYVLIGDPAPDCVDQAMLAIVQLAESRAKRSLEEVHG